jgi:hypothetical protein
MRLHPSFAISRRRLCVAARGIELDVFLLECVTGHESDVCVTHLCGQRLLAEFNCHS